MAWTRGTFQSVSSGPGRGGPGGNVGGVVADPVVEWFSPSSAQSAFSSSLVMPDARGGDRLVEQDRGHRAAEAVARPAA